MTDLDLLDSVVRYVKAYGRWEVVPLDPCGLRVSGDTIRAIRHLYAKAKTGYYGQCKWPKGARFPRQ